MMKDLRKYEIDEEELEDDFEEDEEYWRETHIFKSPEEEAFDKGYLQAIEDVKNSLADSLTKEQLESITYLGVGCVLS